MNLPKLYHELILWIGDGTGLSDAILHIHAGLAVLMIARVVTERWGKALGQNFVIDGGTIRRIVRAAGVAAEDHVLEIAPGWGR